MMPMLNALAITLCRNTGVRSPQPAGKTAGDTAWTHGGARFSLLRTRVKDLVACRSWIGNGRREREACACDAG